MIWRCIILFLFVSTNVVAQESIAPQLLKPLKRWFRTDSVNIQNQKVVSYTDTLSHLCRLRFVYEPNGKLSETYRFFPEGSLEYYSNFDSTTGCGRITWFSEPDLGIYDKAFDGYLPEGVWIEYHPNGAIANISYYSDGVQVGDYEEFNESEQLSMAGYLINGKRDGEWEIYSPNGRLLRIEEYQNGALVNILKSVDGKDKPLKYGNFKNGNGRLIHYHENGKPNSILNYKNGFPTDTAKFFHPNGNLSALGFYKDTLLQGPFFTYDTLGNLESFTTLVNGEKNGKYFEYDPNGNLITLGHYTDDLEDSLWVELYPDSTVERIGIFKLGKPQGWWQTFYDTGELALEQYFNNGLLDSAETEWFPDGALSYEGDFVNGLREGAWVSFFVNGLMADSITYSEGLEVGNCFFYNEDGYIEAVGPMRFGLCHGYWKEYYPDGIIKLEGNYLNDEKQGIWKLNWASGAQCQLLTYENGALMEVSDFITPKGKNLDKGTLVKGNGTRLVYSLKGKLLTETNYVNGLAEGKATAFNEKGKKQAEGKFLNGKKNGIWLFYDEKGKLHTEGNYQNGKPLGIWKYFNAEGKEVERQTIRE